MIGLTRQGVVAASILFTTTSLCIGLLYGNATASLEEEVRTSLVRLATAASTVVPTDALAALDDPSQEWGPTYARVYDPLDRFRAAVPALRYAYTAELGAGDEVRFLVDATPSGDADGDGVDDHAALLEVYDDAEPLLVEVLRTGVAAASQAPYEDAWGTFLSGYAPVRDPDGVVIGAVGVDMTVDGYLAELAGLRHRSLLTVVVAACISAVVGWGTSRLERARRAAEDRATAERDRQRRFLWTVLDTVDDPLLVTGRGGVVLGCNAAWAQLAGTRRDDAVGRPLTTLLPDADDDRDAVDLAPHTRERRDRDRIWVRRRWPARDPDGEPIVVTVESDVTRDREREAGLESARRDAEAAARARSRFLANVSHELRTPTGGVAGMVEHLLTTDLSDEQRSYAQTIRAAAQSLLRLLDELLDFSKLAAGRIELESLPVDLRELTADVSALLAPRAHEKGVELVVRVDADVPAAAVADPTRVRQVLSNLLGNALKFCERGHVLVSVAQDGPRLRFAVQDTGIGISEDGLQRLFAPYQQADPSTTRRFGGTGLGLSISKGLVERMGGEVGVSSAVGQGSTFWFTLPCVPAAPATASAAVPGPPGPVCVALSHPVAAEALCSGLAERGVTVRRASSPAELLDGPPRLVVVDSDWLDTVDALARRGCVVVVAASLPAVAACRRVAGVADVLPRPLRPEVLMSVLDRLGRAASAPPQTAPREAAAPDPDPTPAARPPTRGRVLVAEDNVVNQRVALLYLKKAGVDADLVGNGREAVERVRVQRYDLVLMDCQMPEMDGYEATRAIRRFGSDVPICALTASSLDSDRAACLEAGMNDFLSKPIQVDQLKVLLDRWLRRAA